MPPKKENSQKSRKVAVSKEEEEFFLKVVGVKIVNLTEKHQNLCRVAKQMYGQHTYNQILSRCADSQREGTSSDEVG